MRPNHYDQVIKDLEYYVADKRRSKDFREVLAVAVCELRNANAELKEAQALITEVGKAASATIIAMTKIKECTEGQKND